MFMFRVYILCFIIFDAIPMKIKTLDRIPNVAPADYADSNMVSARAVINIPFLVLIYRQTLQE